MSTRFPGSFLRRAGQPGEFSRVERDDLREREKRETRRETIRGRNRNGTVTKYQRYAASTKRLSEREWTTVYGKRINAVPNRSKNVTFVVRLRLRRWLRFRYLGRAKRTRGSRERISAFLFETWSRLAMFPKLPGSRGSGSTTTDTRTYNIYIYTALRQSRRNVSRRNASVREARKGTYGVQAYLCTRRDKRRERYYR